MGCSRRFCANGFKPIAGDRRRGRRCAPTRKHCPRRRLTWPARTPDCNARTNACVWSTISMIISRSDSVRPGLLFAVFALSFAKPVSPSEESALKNSAHLRCRLHELGMAIDRQRPPGLIHNSDEGIHCTSEGYRRTLATANITPSMNWKGDCRRTRS